jgi:hypothetical protein
MKARARSTFLLVLLGSLLAACASVPSRDYATVAWTQFGWGDQPELIARALIGPGEACPLMTVDGVAAPMRERVDARATLFGRMCEERRTLAQTLKLRIATADRVLLEQEVTRNPANIVALGDTGCRVVSYKDQGCHDPVKWPFARVATAAAATRPNLILHLGDYYYRETPCLGSAKDCKAGVYGDRAATWHAEFFAPARDLLAKAPWVFVRGNHEDCKRGGYGWSYYFGDGEPACEIAHKPAIVRLAGMTLVTIDSAHADYDYGPVRASVQKAWATLAGRIAADADSLLGAPSSPVFVMTHDPAYWVCSPSDCEEEKASAAHSGGIRDLADSIRRSGRRTFMLTGHVHAFQSFDVAPTTLGGRSLTQLILGNGGTDLDKYPASLEPPATTAYRFDDRRLDGSGKEVRRGWPVGTAQVWAKFGFATMAPATMEMVVHDADGRRQFTCPLAEETVSGPRCR